MESGALSTEDKVFALVTREHSPDSARRAQLLVLLPGMGFPAQLLHTVTRKRDGWWVTATLPCLSMERGAHPRVLRLKS